MGNWSIYSAGGTVRATVKSLEYVGNFMGETYVTATVSSPSPIDFAVGDYITYRGEKFVMNTTPSELKQSSTGSYGEAYVYEDMKFDSYSNELVNCQFLDIVRSDNQLHYTALPDFSFYAETIESLAERIQVNLDRIYTGDDAWTVTAHTEFVEKTDVNISVSGINCWEALALANSEFGANFVIRGRTITIGTNGTAIGTVFRYGKNNGLLSLQRTADQDQAVITRLRAYGSTRNMPPHYYANLDSSLPNNYAVKNLMLPSFPSQTYDPYIDSENAETLGIREGAVFFDGSGDIEEIYPSLEGMTAEELIAAGVPCTASGNLDEIVSAEQIADNGIFEDDADVPAFTITIKDIGFDINDYLTGETATISMKDGKCGGREFEITQCVQNNDGSYTLTCNRQNDESLDLWFPYADYNISSGDKFVLLNITMPDAYIQAASQRLLTAAQAYLAKNDYVRYTYEPKIDNIFVQREYDAAADKTTTIYWTIKEGDLMLFQDTDIGIDGSVFIDTLNIKEGDSLIPSIEVTLREDKAVGTIERIQNTIDSLVSGGGQGSGGGVSTSQVRSILVAYGADYFLSKVDNDTAAGNITFDQNIYVGGNAQSTDFVTDASGFGITKDTDGAYHIETDYLKVRHKAFFKEIEVQDVYHVGGQMMLTSASAVCDFVEEQSGSYRCYFRKTDADGRNVKNLWRVGDQAYVNTFNLVDSSNVDSNHMLWRLVTGVDTENMTGTYTDSDGNTYDLSEYHYIDLSMSDCASGSDAPLAGDSIVQLGYRNSDSSRESAIVIAGAGDASAVPYIYEFTGITTYSLPEPVIQISPNGNVFTGAVTLQSGSSIEDDAILDDFTYGKNNLLRNTGFNGDYASRTVASGTEMESGTQMYSPSLVYWTVTNASVQSSEESESGNEIVLTGGTMQQTLYYPVKIAEDLIFSFKGKGTSVTFSVGGATQTVALSDSYNRRVVRFTTTEAGDTFTISESTCTLCEMQLERGTLASASWGASPLDNRSELAEYQNLAYLKNALNNGNTTIIGGLILSSIIQLGNYVDGQMQNVTAGMSGIYNNDNDVSHWSGGTFEQAINTVLAYASDPTYQPTEAEVANFAKFVVTHGGRAILNDVILRGYIYALGGVFNGTVYATDGVFNGTIYAQDGEFTGTVNSTSGTIGGFTLSSGGQTATSGNKTMVLAPNNIVFTNTEFGVTSKFGSGAIGDGIFVNLSVTNPLSIIVSGITEDIKGILLDVSGGTPDDTVPGSGNSAIEIKRGKISGLRTNVRRVTTSTSLSVMDSFIINKASSVITIVLPDTAEDGQMYWIKNQGGNDCGFTLSVLNDSGQTINEGKNDSLTSWTHTTGEMAFVVYDAIGKVWQAGYMNCN